MTDLIIVEFAKAVSKQKCGLAEEALEIYKDIISSNPNIYQVYHNMNIAISEIVDRGISLRNKRILDDTENTIVMALNYGNENANAFMLLGAIKRAKGNFGESLEYFAKSMALNPASEGCRLHFRNLIISSSNTAMEFYHNGDFDSAATLLKAVLAIRPKRYISAEDATLLFKQCQSTAAQLYNRKLYQEAATLIKSILNNHLNAESLHIAGLIAADQNQHAAAVDLFRIAIDTSPNIPLFHVSMGKSLYALKQYDQAERAFTLSLEQDNDYLVQKREVNDEIIKHVHAGRFQRSKTLIFCTSYIENEKSWDERYRIWLKYYRSSMLAHHKMCMIDDGGKYNPDYGDLIFHRFENRLGRKSDTDFPGWWRSFLFSVEVAKREGCNKIVHIESDAFLLSNRIMIYIDSIQNGWISFWCRRWQMPESAIQVICEDNFDKLAKLSEHDPNSEFFLESAESLLPFTKAIKVFKGDRYGEYIDHIPDDADYVCQLSGSMRHTINNLL
ncbi:tetratricopeptide repeat protein [Azospirillum endophyticum]